MISDSVAVVEYYVIKKPIEFISNLFNEYNELKDVYDENKILNYGVGKNTDKSNIKIL